MRVKLTNTQLNKSKSATKNKTETILRLNKKNFEDEELQHELPPGNKTSLRHRNDVSLCIVRLSAGMSQTKHPMTSRSNDIKTSKWYFCMTSHWNVVTTSQDYVRTSPIRVQCLQQVSNETPNHVSVVRVCDVPLVPFYDISCNSEIEHPITLLRYVSTTSQSYFVAMPCYWVSTTLSNYFVPTSICKVSPSHLCMK